MNVILAVTNERFVAESFFSQYYPTGKITQTNIIVGPSDGQNIFAEWKTIRNDVEENNFIREDSIQTGYNIVYVPFQGFAYVLAKARYDNNPDDRYIIATMKESYQTPIISNELYNILLDTRYKAGFSLFTDLFNDLNRNILLESDYDSVYEQARNGEIPLLSDRIHELFVDETTDDDSAPDN